MKSVIEYILNICFRAFQSITNYILTVSYPVLRSQSNSHVFSNTAVPHKRVSPVQPTASVPAILYDSQHSPFNCI